MTEVRFVPGIVEGCATAADGIGGTVSGLAGAFSNTDRTTRQYGALASAQALGSCRTAWSGRISQQGTETGTTGQDLHQAVKNYHASDDAAAGRVRRAGGRLQAI
jgi:hypothetical protein